MNTAEIPSMGEFIFPEKPKKSDASFSRQWSSANPMIYRGTDAVDIATRIDATRQKLLDLNQRLNRLGPVTFEFWDIWSHLHWLSESIGIFRTAMIHDKVLPAKSKNNGIRFQFKLAFTQVYPQTKTKKKVAWDAILLGPPDKKYVADMYCIVMPSLETIEWLNNVDKMVLKFSNHP